MSRKKLSLGTRIFIVLSLTALIINGIVYLNRQQESENVFTNGPGLPTNIETWSGIFYSWLDENENGVWDSGEAGLTDISFHIEANANLFSFDQETIVPGVSRNHINFYECELAGKVTVGAKIPDGFRLTTPESYRIKPGFNCSPFLEYMKKGGGYPAPSSIPRPLEIEEAYLFGFAPISSSTNQP